MDPYDVMPEPPPRDYDTWEPPPPDGAFALPDDPFMGGMGVAEAFDTDYLPEHNPWEPVEPEVKLDAPPQTLDFDTPMPVDERWQWQDARLIGLDREDESGVRYEIGAVEMYANPNTGDLGGTYLPIASFEDVDVAAAFYDDLHGQIHDGGLTAYEIAGFAENQAAALQSEPVQWRSAGQIEYDAYEQLQRLDGRYLPEVDVPPAEALDPLLQAAIDLGGVVVREEVEVAAPAADDRAAFQALNAIGIEAEGFDPAKDPPPFIDPQAGRAYWIGVFQADKDDPDHCVASILSLGRNPETDELEAQFAPCVPGTWDKAYSAAEYLIDVAQKGGIERCFDAAEGMALATDQRGLWDDRRGVQLEPQEAQGIAEYAREQWEVDL